MAVVTNVPQRDFSRESSARKERTEVRRTFGTTMWSVLAGGAVLASTLASPAQAVAPPLDPISAAEIGGVMSILTGAGLVDGTTRFPAIRLIEPSKTEVLDWPSSNPRRKAFVVRMRDRRVFEDVVDLTRGRVQSTTEVTGVQPQIL